jgi:hypothetical protein
MIHFPFLNLCILILEMYQHVERFVTVPVREGRLLLSVEKCSASTLLTVNSKGHQG